MRNRNFRNRNSNSKTSFPEIILTPLIDTALTLLVIFMITAPIMKNLIKVELPKTKLDEKDGKEQDNLIITIDRDKTIYLNDKIIKIEDLILTLEKDSEKYKDEIIFINADKFLEYGDVVNLVDKIKSIDGIKYVALATEKNTE